MKLTIVLLIAASLHLSATGFGQKVSISGKDLSLEKVFTMIKKQTNYVFFYDYSIFQGARPVSLDLKDAEVEDVLRTCLQGQNLDFSITNQTISITKKAVKATIPPVSPGNPPEVVGTVRSDNGAPLAGATVYIKKLNKSGSTNALGEFILKDVPNGKYSVEISYIGYEKYVTEILVENHEVRIAADMRLATNSLDQAIVKGYYTTTNRLNTGNVSTVKAEDIEKQPVSNPLAALEGRVTGLFITSSSGRPGSTYNVQLRGKNSISNGNDPLYIIDGVPFVTSFTSFIGITSVSPFNSINPSDISSIEVLKDADATAIYGSRGANGVILITTKKGKAGVTKVDAKLYSGIGQVNKISHLLNTPQYLRMRHEAFYNDSLTAPTAINARPNNTNAPDLLLWDTTRYTDWQRVLIGGTAHYTDAQSSVSGGNTNTQFLIGAGFHKETSIYPGDFSDQRESVHINLSHNSSNQKFKIGISTFYTNNANLLPTNDLTAYIVLPADAPTLYDANGKLNWASKTPGTMGTWINPFSYLLVQTKTETNNLNANTNLSYELLPGLTLKSNMGYNNIQSSNLQTTPLSSYDPANTSALASAQYGNIVTKTWIIEPQLNYHNRIGAGQLEILMGGTFLNQTQNSLSQTGRGYTSDVLLPDIQAAATLMTNGASYFQYHYDAIFGRINYNWEEKYLINVTARRDGSSRFGPGKQFGNFGAIGAGWIFSKEKCIQNNLSFLSFGKLRVSYGTSGNDQIGDYNYLDTYTPGINTYQGVTTLSPVRLSNSNYAWENNKKFEVGTEVGIIKDKVLISASYYRNRSSNQLLQYTLPAITGFYGITANLPATVQNTGIEFSVNVINIKTKNFVWTSSANVTIPRNKLVSYPDLASSTYSDQYVVGQSLFISKKYQYVGVNPQTGLYSFNDYDKDGNISSPNDKKYIINTGQQFYGGLQNNLQYKNWQFDVFFQFTRQKYGNNFLSYFQNMPGTINNQPDYILSHWQNPGDNTTIQKFSNSNALVSTAFRDMAQSNKVYSDASYVRLKNVSISYRLPTNGVSRTPFKDVRIYVQGQNLFVITNYLGLDPETQGQLPVLRVITAGIQLGL